jgi:hypothetical protein
MTLQRVETSAAAVATEESSKDKVDAPSHKYMEWMSLSDLPRTLLKGTRGMKAAKGKYLTQNALETDKAFETRLEASALLNAFKKTCSFLSGQVFQADIVFDDTVDVTVLEQSSDVDGKGNNINVFAKRVFFNGIGKGVALILVDATAVEPDTNRTVAEEQALGVRTFFKEVRPEDLIGYRLSDDGTLAQIRIAETKTKPDGLYGEKDVQCIRLFNDDGTWELYEKQDDGEYIVTKSGALSYKGVPIVPFIPGEEFNVVAGESPLMDLAELNLAHWRSKSDQTHILHVGRVPLLFGRHLNMDTAVSGVSSLLNSDEDGSDLKFVEISGAAIAAGAADLKETEAQMALYGLQQLVPRSGNQTATEKAITSSESNSSLGTWATEFETILTMAYTIAGEFQNKEFPQEGLSVNKEYDLGIADSQELLAILKANEQGVISAQSAFTEFRRRGVFDEHMAWRDIEDEKELEAANAPDMQKLSGTNFNNDTGEE